jgi:hypothetical protein
VSYQAKGKICFGFSTNYAGKTGKHLQEENKKGTNKNTHAKRKQKKKKEKLVLF